jgi:Carbohydrate family 9 binding domain-like/HNH endonuclease
MGDFSSRLRQEVIQRANNCCEYCGLSQVGQEATFHIDHIHPVASGGETHSDNLALACVSCSLRKGARTVAVDPQSEQEVSLYNPRLNNWQEHFYWDGVTLMGKTTVGRATVVALQMNRSTILAIRREEILLGRHPMEDFGTERQHPNGYVCYFTDTPLIINGDLTKDAWQAAPWTADFVDIEGDKKPLPRFRTRAKMLWDENYFYIAAEMEEPHVWGTLTEHDSVIFYDNDFEVFIDPDGDNHDYGELEINALNTTWDLRLPKPYRNGGPAIDAWEIEGMKTAVSVQGTLNNASDTDTAWCVEMALPWDALASLQGGACPVDGQQWRVNFSRVEWDIEIIDGAYHKIPNRPEHNWVWSPQGVIDMHRPEFWGYVQFSKMRAGTGTVPFQLAPEWATRCALMAVYEAQKEAREASPTTWYARQTAPTGRVLTVQADSRLMVS